jgi:hypothetical protein
MARFKDDVTAVDSSDGVAEAKRRILKTLTSMGVVEDLSDAQAQQITDRTLPSGFQAAN